MEDQRLAQAIRGTKEFLNLNHEHDDGDDFTDGDALDYLEGDCGKQRDGTCLYAGSEQCDWECPFS